MKWTNYLVLVLIFCAKTIYPSSTSIFTITPLTTIPLAVTGDQTVIIEYTVKNNTPYRLAENGVLNLSPALTQITTGKGTCAMPFSLASQKSCILKLQINASEIHGSLKGGPTVCNTLSHPVYCSTPLNALNVIKLPQSDIDFEQIVFLRHGEKPHPGMGQLTCQGLNRALKLPRVLNALFGKPDFIFAPSPAAQEGGGNVFHSYVRPLMTIEPTAIQFDKTIYTALSFSDDRFIASTLLSSNYQNSLIYVSWEHVNIIYILRDIFEMLGVNIDIPRWHDEDYDSLYVVSIARYLGVPAVSLKVLKQNLTHESQKCPTELPLTSIPEKLSNAAGNKTKIYFVPTGAPLETTPVAQLSCAGLNRSLGLISVFADHGIYPDFFYAPAPSLMQYSNSGRFSPNENDYLPSLLLEPTAISQSKPYTTLFGFEDNFDMANYLLSSPLANSVMAVAWDMTHLPDLIKRVYVGAGGSNFTPPVIDPYTIYVMDFNNGNPVLTSFPELLSPKEICPYPIH